VQTLVGENDDDVAVVSASAADGIGMYVPLGPTVKLAKGNTFGTSTRGCKSGNAGLLPDIENTSRAFGHANPRLISSYPIHIPRCSIHVS